MGVCASTSSHEETHTIQPKPATQKESPPQQQQQTKSETLSKEGCGAGSVARQNSGGACFSGSYLCSFCVDLLR